MPRFQAGPDRGQLGFVDAVQARFGWLDRDGTFRVVRSEPTLVRFESSLVFVDVFHGRGSYELGVEIGRCGRDLPVGFSLLEILALGEESDTATYRPIEASTRDAVMRGVKRLGELTRAHASLALNADETFFDRLAAQRKRQSRELTESYAATSLRSRADKAWTARDYVGVLAAYRKLAELETVHLTRSELARLNYAEMHIEA